MTQDTKGRNLLRDTPEFIFGVPQYLMLPSKREGFRAVPRHSPRATVPRRVATQHKRRCGSWVSTIKGGSWARRIHSCNVRVRKREVLIMVGIALLGHCARGEHLVNDANSKPTTTPTTKPTTLEQQRALMHDIGQLFMSSQLFHSRAGPAARSCIGCPRRPNHWRKRHSA